MVGQGSEANMVATIEKTNASLDMQKKMQAQNIHLK
jgi:hypothetical protein